MARPPLLLLQDVALTFGGTPLLTAATLSVGVGERIALVGRNGSGKSTLLKVAAGLVEADGGRHFVEPSATVRYLAQEPDLSAYSTVLEYVATGLAPGDDAHAAQATLDALSLSPDAAPKHLSGGEARRAALAHALAADPDVLLLDEPTNHLDIAAIETLEAMLSARRGALVLISHDRRVLERLSTATVWLDRGATSRMDKPFAEFEDWRDQQLAAEAEELRRLDKKIAVETSWVRTGVTARRRRNMGRMRNLEALRQQRREARRSLGTANITMGAAERSGRRLIVAEGVAKSFGEEPVVQNLDLTVMRGDRLGIVGPNGAGKTTLINLLLGRLAPDAGTVRHGVDLKVNLIDQRREALQAETPLRRAISPAGADQITVGGTTKHVATYLQDFLFTPEQFGTPVGALSGGERARVLLGRAFALPSNVLVLDEPTNDLDLETLDLLAELLADTDATVLLVSHDRDFLDRTVTSVLVSEGAGRWQEYAGGYTDMLAQRGDTPIAAGQEPPVRKPARSPEPRAERRRTKEKLSFRETHDLKVLPERIETLEAKIAELGQALSDTTLYAKDPARFAKLTEELTARQSERDSAEERWLELEMKREELEAG